MGLPEIRVIPGPADVVLPAFLDATFSAVVSACPASDPLTWEVIARALSPDGVVVVLGDVDTAGAIEGAGLAVLDKHHHRSGRFSMLAVRPGTVRSGPLSLPDGDLWEESGRAFALGPGQLIVDPWAGSGCTALAAREGCGWVGITAPGTHSDVLTDARARFSSAAAACRQQGGDAAPRPVIGARLS